MVKTQKQISKKVLKLPSLFSPQEPKNPKFFETVTGKK